MEKLLIVGQHLGDPDRWGFIGVFDNADKALAACTDEDCFIGEALLNVAEKEDTDWVLYYPLLQAAPEWFANYYEEVLL